MNENFPHTPPNEPQGESVPFHNDEPNPETLTAINDQFKELSELGANAEYRRGFEMSLKDDLATQIEPLSVSVTSYDKINDSNHSDIRIQLPSVISQGNGGTLHKWSPIFIFENTNGDVSAKFITPINVSPQSLLEPLLSHDDLPECVARLASETTIALREAGDYNNERFDESDHTVPLTPDQYDYLWRHFQEYMDSEEANIPTKATWNIDSETSMKVSENLTVISASVEAIVSQNDYAIEFADLSTNRFYYYQQSGEQDQSRSSFQEIINDSELPELTHDELRKHPYSVIPVGMLQQEPEDQKIIPGLKDIGTDRHATGYMVISTNTTSEVQNMRHFEDVIEAQAYADWLYKKQLQRERATTSLTEKRSMTILDTLKKLSAYIKQHPPTNN